LLGWFLDDIVVFLFRTIVRFLREDRSRDWPVTSGTVEQSHCPETAMYPLAELVYSYSVDGVDHSGSFKRGFWHQKSAERYAGRFLPGSKLVVRYRPGEAAESCIREDDQAKPGAPAIRDSL